MIKIRVKTIPHNKQRYNTAGDYWDDKGQKEIRVSELSNPIHEFIIAVHEIVEAYLTEARGIKEQDILKYDVEKLKHLKDPNRLDPGHDPKAPYHKEHMFAEKIEKMLAKEFAVNLEEYQAELDKLSDKKGSK
jgi:hypothetical protein